MSVDQEKIRQKIHFIRENLAYLEEFKDLDKESFKSDHIKEAAAIRMLQVAIEAVLDICSHIISREGWGLPKSYLESVELAVQNGLIPLELAQDYKNMAKFRNRVVHLYDKVDSEELIEIINSHLDDFKPFIQNVLSRYMS